MPRKPFRVPSWFVIAPLLVVAGAVLARAFPSVLGRAPERVWSEPEKLLPARAPVAAQLTSLAPMVERLQAGVVSVSSARRRDTANEPETGLLSKRFRSPVEDVYGVVVRGTGFIIHADGLVVTSHHVVAGGVATRVVLQDNREYDAEVVGEDSVSDVALLRIVSPPPDLVVLSLGDSTAARQGDFVMTLGNPHGLSGSLGFGILSHVGRHLEEDGMRVTSEHLQFTAAVNSGDSGAPLLDMAGHVIGVTRRTLVGAQGISFATPSQVVKRLASSVSRGEARIRRGYAGLQFKPPTNPEALRGLVVDGGGAEVTRVFTGRPADLAGIKVGDVVISYADEPVLDPADLHKRIVSTRPGSRKPVSIYRGGEVLMPIEVTIGEIGGTGEPE